MNLSSPSTRKRPRNNPIVVRDAKAPLISVILPCRNEEKALPKCLKELKSVIAKNKFKAEIIVSDSSSDNSPQLAKRAKVRLVSHHKNGYGNAYLEGVKHAKGDYLFMADADCSYDFKEMPRFIKALEQGNDLVIGDRFAGTIHKGSMPFLHRYIGNPLLSFILNLFFGKAVNDCHCGMRAMTKRAWKKLFLQTTGMEFASEMIVKAIRKDLKIKQFPINYYQRVGDSKLKTFNDGWRHLRFMLIYSPFILFALPGLILTMVGLVGTLLTYFGKFKLLGIQFFYHPLFLFSACSMVGYQLVLFYFFARTFAVYYLGEKSPFVSFCTRLFAIEKAGLLGLVMALTGAGVYLKIFTHWYLNDFPAIQEIKNSILALNLVVLGLQTLFSSFMLNILALKKAS